MRPLLLPSSARRSPALTGLVSVLLVTGGCATRRQTAAATAVTAVAAIAAGVAVGNACSDTDQDCEPVVNILFGAIPLFTAGAILGGTSVALYATAPSPIAAVATPTPTPPPPALLPARTAAPETTRCAYEARVAAGLGRCPEARVWLRRVADLDSAYYADLIALPVFDGCR